MAVVSFPDCQRPSHGVHFWKVVRVAHWKHAVHMLTTDRSLCLYDQRTEEGRGRGKNYVKHRT